MFERKTRKNKDWADIQTHRQIKWMDGQMDRQIH